MIIDLKKYLIMGVKEDLEKFFSRAQEMGAIEFISPTNKKMIELPPELQHLVEAMRILRKLAVKKPYEGGGDLSFADEVATRIIELKSEVEKLMEEKRLVELEIARVAPFGDFSIDDIDYIENEGKRDIQFFCMKSDKSHQTNFGDEIIYVSTDYDLDYFIGINAQAKNYPHMIEMRIDRPLGELQTHLAFVKESLHQLEAELKGYAGHLHFLQNALIERLNDYNLAHAKKDLTFPIGNQVFAVEAWVPKNKQTELHELTSDLAVHCEPIVIEESDKVPTYLENRGTNRIGEDLVKIYEIPSPMDKDPSGWVFWSFALFFAMIVADGGYGILYLALMLYLRYKYPNMPSIGKRFVKLGLVLSCMCIVWGVLTSAFFGLQIDPKSPLGRLSVVQQLAIKKADYHFKKKDDVYQFWVKKIPAVETAQNGEQFLDQAVVEKHGHLQHEVLETFSDNILLEFSLMIGVIHLTFSFLRYLKRNWAGIGWIAFMIGGYFYLPTLLHASSILNFTGIIDKETGAAVGLQLIYSGIAAALVLALLQKKWGGLGEIAVMIQVFGDVLSYLRLYALGLAGAIMAATFNDIGMAVGLFFGWIVILFGHSVNILLGIQAGTIHGLRLNFIEWYHYSFEGGGRLFRPLMRFKTKEHS